jgi:hypothetical protein
MNVQLCKSLAAVALFSIAMALLESAVVVYFRELYYPDGFTVTLREIPQRIIVVEMCRELATMVMLLLIGWFVGKTMQSRVAWFLFSFAVWDIFYYLWLKVFIHWPSGVFEWDILFLLPVVWLGPVIAPVINSLTMIGLSVIILAGTRISKLSWTLVLLGAFAIYISYTKEYTSIIIQHQFYKDGLLMFRNPEFTNIAKTFIPQSFCWGIFWIGELLILGGMGLSLFRR